MAIYEPLVILKPEMVQIAPTARIDAFCKIEGGEGVTIGANVHVASFCHINAGGGSAVLEDHCGLASGAKVISGQPDLTYRAICPQEPDGTHGVIRKRTTIGAYALLAANAIVLPGVTVGEGAIVAAGAVVTKDVPPWAVVAGVPARVVGKRTLRPEEARSMAEVGDCDWVGV